MIRRAVYTAALAVCVSLGANSALAAIGRTPTSWAVSNTGEAAYSVPIWTPAGTAGLTPSLALAYGHRNGGSLTGEGWGVSGLSSITRCAKTWAQDGEQRSVKLDMQDRFCLNGNQLKLVAGTYGTNGAEYRTELETFARIRSYGAAGNGPAYFVVETKDGLIAEYGNTTNSRIESVGTGTARAWLINQRRDRRSNYINYSYNEDGALGSYQIATISYTGNSTYGIAPPYQVAFVYQTQPANEVESGYLANSLIKDVVRMTQVNVTHNGTLLRRYNLNYESNLSSSSKSRLANIIECAGSSGTDCLPATTFSYQNGTNTVGTKWDVGLTAGATPHMLDVNGDGKTDIVYSSSSACGVGTWMVRFGSAAGFGAAVDTGITNHECYAAVGIDYNSDGLGDILVPYSGGTWWVLLGTTSGLASPINTGITANGYGGIRALDYNGDGRDDVVYTDGNQIFYRLRDAGGTFGAEQTLVPYPGMSIYLAYDNAAYQYQRNPDFNADGRDDFVYVAWYYDWWTETYFLYTYAVLSSGGTIYLGDGDLSSHYVDLNRDGMTDMVMHTGASLLYRLSTGSTFTAWLQGPATPNGGSIAIADWDADGYEDVFVAGTDNIWSVARATGEGLAALVSLGVSTSQFSVGYTGDLDGNGLTEPVYFHTGSGVLSTNLHSGAKPDLLTTATDGFGNWVSFYYTTPAQGNYTKYSDATFPYQDYQGSLSVVSQYIASNGIGGTYTVSYWYWGAHVHRQGRGLMGFYAMEPFDSRNNIHDYRWFRRDFPYAGQVAQHNLYQPTWEVISSTTTYGTMAHLTLGSGSESRFVPYPYQSNVYRYNVGGPYNGSPMVHSVTMNTAPDSTSGEIYDSTTVTTEYGSGNGVQPGQTWTSRTYVTSLQSDTTNWCLGKPYTVQQYGNHTGYGGGSVMRTSGSTWDMAQCRPTQTKVQPGDPSWEVATNIGYDNFGNVNSQSVVGVGLAARTTTMNWGSNGLRLLSTTNPLGHVTQQSWNPSGTVASVTDPNGLVTSWVYDNFNRKTHEFRPDSTWTHFTIGLCAPGNCGWTMGYYSQYVYNYSSGGSLVNWQGVLKDSSDRAVETMKQGLNNTQDTVLYLYTALGQVSQETLPYVCCSNPAYWQQYSYDLLGRKTADSRPINSSNSTLQTTYTYYDGLTTRVVDPQGRTTKAIANAVGQVRRTIDADNYYKQFDFDAFGNAIRVQDTYGATNQSASFNVRGLRYQSVDSDMGTWNYTYNALGEMTQHTDAKGQVVGYQYDKLGRMTQKTEPSPISGTITSTWTWGSNAAVKEIGKLYLAEVSGGGATFYREASYYDSFGRNYQNSYWDGATWHSVNYTFNSASLVDSINYPTSTSGYRHQVVNEYSYGQLKRVRDYANTVNYWTANTTDARNNVTDETLGNGLRTTRGIDGVTGLPHWINTGPGGGGTVQNLDYSWDKVGNLLHRRDALQNLIENFTYDNQYRLDYSTLNGTQNLNVDYNYLGNITNKSDVGAYSYAGPRMHAVTNVAGVSYNYDNNGNITSRGSSTVSYYAHNKPYVMNNGTYSSTFEYGPNGNYWKQVATYSNGTETTKYIGGLLEIVQGPSVTSYRHHIKAGRRTVAIYSRGSNGANNTIYLLNDHLGSTDAVTNSSGGIIVKQSFAAFGSRRNGSTWSGAPSGADMTAIGDATRRGYTDHSMLDNIGLVHMNGRVQDPVLGRFVSPDPNIDGHGFAGAGFNRYSYVWNNPLSKSDPTGFCSGCHGGSGSGNSNGGLLSSIGNFISNLFGNGANSLFVTNLESTMQRRDPETGLQEVIVVNSGYAGASGGVSTGGLQFGPMTPSFTPPGGGSSSGLTCVPPVSPDLFSSLLSSSSGPAFEAPQSPSTPVTAETANDAINALGLNFDAFSQLGTASAGYSDSPFGDLLSNEQRADFRGTMGVFGNISSAFDVAGVGLSGYQGMQAYARGNTNGVIGSTLDILETGVTTVMPPGYGFATDVAWTLLGEGDGIMNRIDASANEPFSFSPGLDGVFYNPQGAWDATRPLPLCQSR